ncbi:MAG: hypothetical protein MUD01_12805 [Chloroflexaceae bacterium]|jgi:predicted nucleic acid-binding protein|nr:hypothetical protein [Chloroflexaceae bacterium]
MTRAIILDAGPLGLLAHPRKHPEAKNWLRSLLLAGIPVALPEIVDYEVRRELLRLNATAGIARLDTLKSTLWYLPITTSAMLTAAQYWAKLRLTGLPTAANAALDADVILAAQTDVLAVGGYTAIVATTNVRHLTRLVPAAVWNTITP